MTKKLKDLCDRMVTSSQNIFDEAIADEDFMKECVQITCDNSRKLGLKSLEFRKEYKLSDKEVSDEFTSIGIEGQCKLLKGIHSRLLIGRHQFLKEIVELNQEDYLELELSFLSSNMRQSQNFAQAILKASEPELTKVAEELTEKYEKMIDGKIDDEVESDYECGCPIYTIPENEKKDQTIH